MLLFSKRRWQRITQVVAVLFCLLCVAFVFLWWKQPRDPVYKGRRLSALLYAAHAPVFAKNTTRLVRFATPQNSQPLARSALRELGPEAVPLLAHWLSTTEPAWRDWARGECQKRALNWPWFT